MLVVVTGSAGRSAAPAWTTAKVIELAGTTVTVSKPVLVGRGTDRLWFPTLIKLADGRLVAIMSIDYDSVKKQPLATFFLSTDGGWSWDDMGVSGQPGSSLLLPNGDCLLLPVYLSSHPQGMTGRYQVIPAKQRIISEVKDKPLIVSGLPRKPTTVDMGNGSACFGFNGQTITLKDGNYLATLYGRYAGDEYYHLITVTSQDGITWQYCSTIATPAIIPRGTGGEGPTEAALCRLKDGRIMCTFRISSGLTYGQAWSTDEGKTWTEPTRDYVGDASLTMKDKQIRSVQPSLAVLRNGMVILSGGRPGVSVWINTERDGKDWAQINLSELHNASHPDEPHVVTDGDATKHSTSGYTEVIALNDHELLVIYDRLRGGWDNQVKDPTQTNSVWVVRLTLKSLGIPLSHELPTKRG